MISEDHLIWQLTMLGAGMSVMEFVTVLLLGAALGGRSQAGESALQPTAQGEVQPSETADPPPIDYMIVVTGNELLEGQYADGHTVFITRTLLPLGYHCLGSMIVDDRREDIAEALRFASRKAKLVIVTGGLGPTENDVTREALAEFTGIELKEHPEALREMERRFNTPAAQLRPNLRKQTQVPVRGTYLKNPNGTAVGLVFDKDDLLLAALPGPPRELQPMVRDELLPYLDRRLGKRPRGCMLQLRFVGVGQSQIDHTLKQHGPLPEEMIWFSTFEAGRVDFTFVLPQDNQANRARLESVRQLARQHLAEYLYAEDATTLEEHVLQLLEQRGQRLALAEVGSGGSLAAAIGNASNARRALAGALVAADTDSLRRMLQIADAAWPPEDAQAERLRQLAQTTGKLTGADWVVVLGEPTRQADGNRSIVVAVKDHTGKVEQLQQAAASGEAGRAVLVTRLLDHLRRRLR